MFRNKDVENVKLHNQNLDMQAELATLRAEYEESQKALRIIKMYIEDGATISALLTAKEALK